LQGNFRPQSDIGPLYSYFLQDEGNGTAVHSLNSYRDLAFRTGGSLIGTGFQIEARTVQDDGLQFPGLVFPPMVVLDLLQKSIGLQQLRNMGGGIPEIEIPFNLFEDFTNGRTANNPGPSGI